VEDVPVSTPSILFPVSGRVYALKNKVENVVVSVKSSNFVTLEIKNKSWKILQR
jgi:hypothetical protein